MNQQVTQFIDQFIQWAATQTDILAVALVGSHARNTARKDSDIDLVILTDEPANYLSKTEWTEVFGMAAKYQVEDYGMLSSLRVWYQNGLEVEYGITTRAWAQVPLDEGTRSVVQDGMRVLFEREPLLSPHETRMESADTQTIHSSTKEVSFSTILYYAANVVYFLLFLGSCPYVLLSPMAFDGGDTSSARIAVLLVLSFPFIIIGIMAGARYFYKKGRIKAALQVLLIPPLLYLIFLILQAIYWEMFTLPISKANL